MPPAERRLGDLLLSFPGDIATFSATELATMAGTSKAAASRLFQRLGYSDFNEVRREARSGRAWGSPLYLVSTEQEESAQAHSIASHLAQETENLVHTLEALDPDSLQAAAEAIAGAPRVYVVGFRNSRMLAFYLQRQLQLMRPNTVLLPGAGQTLGEDLADLSKDDVFVVIGMRRRVAAVIEVLEQAKRAGNRSLLITDPSATRGVKLATWSLSCEVRSGSILDSYTATSSVLNLLCAAVLNHYGRAVHERLRHIEQVHKDLSELDQTPWFSRLLADDVEQGDAE
jgi:DNA-binding MurR/RpiR family transcriptional regulator